MGHIDECKFCQLASDIDYGVGFLGDAEENDFLDDVIAEVNASIEKIKLLPICQNYLRLNLLTCTLCGGLLSIGLGYPPTETYVVQERSCDCFLWNEYRTYDGHLVRRG